MPKIIFQPLMIANPQSIKRLGHFLTADNISAGTPNGELAYPALRNPPIPSICRLQPGAGDNISPEHKEVRSFFDGGLHIRQDA